MARQIDKEESLEKITGSLTTGRVASRREKARKVVFCLPAELRVRVSGPVPSYVPMLVYSAVQAYKRRLKVG